MTDTLLDAGFAHMRWNAPLSQDHAALLLERLATGDGAHVLDLGCGWAELLARAVETAGPGTTGRGVDTDGTVLARGRSLLGARGLADRVTLTEAEAARWRDPADRLICVGASHAWPSLGAAFEALAALARPGARVLFGDGVWEDPPTREALAIFGEAVPPLGTLVAAAESAGWRVLHLSTADQREWDDFESTWRAGRQQWLLENPDDERAPDLRRKLDAQQAEYLTVYRGVLGFAYLVLGR